MRSLRLSLIQKLPMSRCLQWRKRNPVTENRYVKYPCDRAENGPKRNLPYHYS